MPTRYRIVIYCVLRKTCVVGIILSTKPRHTHTAVVGRPHVSQKCQQRCAKDGYPFCRVYCGSRVWCVCACSACNEPTTHTSTQAKVAWASPPLLVRTLPVHHGSMIITQHSQPRGRPGAAPRWRSGLDGTIRTRSCTAWHPQPWPAGRRRLWTIRASHDEPP